MILQPKRHLYCMRLHEKSLHLSVSGLCQTLYGLYFRLHYCQMFRIPVWGPSPGSETLAPGPAVVSAGVGWWVLNH